MSRPFHKGHWVALACLWIGFSIATCLVTNDGLDLGPDHDKRIIQATLGTITGPLTGAIARDFQECCLRFSLVLMAFSGPVLLVGILIQVLKLPDQRWVNWMRMGLWVFGWVAWFLSGSISLTHALG
jgi:hypothetical protein